MAAQKHPLGKAKTPVRDTVAGNGSFLCTGTFGLASRLLVAIEENPHAGTVNPGVAGKGLDRKARAIFAAYPIGRKNSEHRGECQAKR